MNKCKLGDLLEIKQGYAFKSANYVTQSPYALLTLANISGDNNFQFAKSKTTYYGSNFPNEFVLKGGDLVMPLTEQVVGLFGNSAFVPPINGITFVLNQRVGKVIPKNGKSDIYYLHFLLSTEMVKKQLEYRSSGTRQRNISPSDIYDVDVYVPTYDIQKKIGKTLYDYERKINNNNKINSELESLAKTIYDYWFLQFDFPNEEGKPYKSSGGAMEYNEQLKMDIPKGWEVKQLGSIVVEQKKSTIPVEDAKKADGDIPFFTSGDSILNWNEPLVDGRNCYVNDGGNADVRYYVGEAAYSTHTWCIQGKDNTPDFLYLTLMALKPEMDIKYFQGSTLKNLNKSAFKKRLFFIPPTGLLDRFNRIIQPMFDMISENTRENQELTNLRDYLLPLLMNGQVGFKDE